MKSLLRKISSIRVAAVTTLLIALCAWTVGVQGQPTIPPAQRTLNLTAEQEHVIKEIILKDVNVPKAKPDAPETIGDAVPENIDLYPFPPEITEKVSQVKSHKFFVKGDTIILVSPTDRRIADVIKKSND
jgi:Protein of unknown function (DUF1236)